MGQEIQSAAFSAHDVEAFLARVREETKILKRWFDQRRFLYSDTSRLGLEVEAWLVDENRLPAPQNEAFLAAVNSDLVVPELSQFNFEINTEPLHLRGDVFTRLRTAVEHTWSRCRDGAAGLGLAPVVIGILPTVREAMLKMETMSRSNRYQALNERLFALRGGAALPVRIAGYDDLDMVCTDLMIEAACTSIQVHVQLNQEEAARVYNASLIVSAPVLAATTNSPFLYGHSLWCETRIPTFEQAVAAASFRDIHGRPVHRVTFGSGYVRHSLLELFLENLDGYVPLLPALSDTAPERLAHLRLHNGTIWRWNRPIIGLDASGEPHLRLEHRVMPAGPTLVDMIANTAFYVGLMRHYARREVPPEADLDFETARANFYAAARDGLGARVRWLQGEGDMQTLLLERLIPDAKAGLADLGVHADDIRMLMDDILHPRVLTGRTGTQWQRSFVNVHGPDFQRLTERYVELQEAGAPVHGWTV